MKKVLVIVGPTAVGKSDFAILCAKLFNGEIISGDSIQVYKGFDIGSGKVKQNEMQGIVHHNLDIKEENGTYSTYEFQQRSRKLIDEINSRNKLPIIAGGTGLYIKSTLYDYDFKEQEEIDYSKYDAMSNQELINQLKVKDPKSLEVIHPNNRKRLVRALAFYDVSGQAKSENIANQKKEMLYDAMIIGCTLKRQELYDNINLRVEKMFEAGLEDEVENLANKVGFKAQAMQGIGYREFKGYFDGDIDIDTCKKLIQKNSRNFAKRQYTFFKNQLVVNWVDMASDKDIAIEKIKGWLNNDR